MSMTALSVSFVAKGIELSTLFCMNPTFTCGFEGELYPVPVSRHTAVYGEVGERIWGGQSVTVSTRVFLYNSYLFSLRLHWVFVAACRLSLVVEHRF